MHKIKASVACNLDTHMLQATLPLFESGRVDGLEWSFDALYQFQQIPEWFEHLLSAFSQEKCLIGHGVFFSLFSGKWLPEQQAWLEHLKKTVARWPLDHVTEHFGFMTGDNFHNGAPVSIPYNKTTLRIGRDRIMRIQDAAQCPVGLENLALSYSLDDVKKHGEFLDQLIEPVNGFIILDLHNLYCQAHNFSIEPTHLLQLYPLGRVREIHISGGSWERFSEDPSFRVRRDTHDERVPDIVFDLLQYAISHCPNLKYVVLEQLGSALATQEQMLGFQSDFYRMANLVEQVPELPAPQHSFLPFEKNILSPYPEEDELLYFQQRLLTDIFEQSPDLQTARTNLHYSPLALSDWHIEQWSPAMLETAVKIARKWK